MSRIHVTKNKRISNYEYLRKNGTTKNRNNQFCIKITHFKLLNDKFHRNKVKFCTYV